MQFEEKVGLPRNIVCSRRLSLQDNPSETDFAHKMESSFKLDGGGYKLVLPGTKIPIYFNHRSVGSSVSFSTDQKSLTFACCIALKVEVKDTVLRNQIGWGTISLLL